MYTIGFALGRPSRQQLCDEIDGRGIARAAGRDAGHFLAMPEHFKSAAPLLSADSMPYGFPLRQICVRGVCFVITASPAGANTGHALDKYRHGESPFALVTGASGGIGKELAIELARLEFNVVIHGRNKGKLEGVRSEILKEHPETTVVCLVHDAGEKADWPELMKQVEGLNITILINNVGSSGPCPINSLEAATDEQIETVIRVNTIFPSQLTRNLLPTLLKNSPSLILTLTSGAITLPTPMITVYAGAKASNLVWSQALTNEMHYLHRDVTVKAVMTAEVQSDGYHRPTKTFMPTAKVYAQSLLSRADSSGSVYNGWWRHSLQFAGAGLVKIMPSFVVNGMVTGIVQDLLEWRQSVGDPTAMKPL